RRDPRRGRNLPHPPPSCLDDPRILSDSQRLNLVHRGAVSRGHPQISRSAALCCRPLDTVEAAQTRGVTMSKYTVDSEAVQAASASIRGVTEQLRADVNTLMGQIQNLQS